MAELHMRLARSDLTQPKLFVRVRAFLRAQALMSFSLVLAAGFIGLTAWVLWEARQDARADTALSSANIVAVMERDIERNFELYDLSLAAVDEALRIPHINDVSPELRRSALFDGAASARYMGAILVFDASGKVIADSRTDHVEAGTYKGLDPTHRDYFTAHVNDNSSAMFIGKPFKSQLTGQWSISVSRRLGTADGSFGGVVVGSVQLAFFQNTVNQLRLGSRANVILLGNDGTLILREPFNPDDIGRDLSKVALFDHYPTERSGTYETISQSDGVRRMYTFTQIGGLPLVISVAMPLSEIYAGWTRRAVVIGGIVLLLTGGMLVTVRLMQRELVRRKAAEVTARESGARYRMLTENSSDIILRVKLDGTLRYISPSIEEMLGYQPSELSGSVRETLIDPRDIGAIDKALTRLRAGVDHATATYRWLRKDGSEVWVESVFRLLRDPVTGEPQEAIANCRDVTRRKRAEADLALAAEDLARSAATDGLTGLANRRRFDEMLSIEWRRSQREHTFIALMLLDADCFKAFNDQYGHQAGDEALKLIANGISGNIRRPGDLAARYGGEEFAVVMPNTDMAGGLHMAERVRAAVEAAGMRHNGSPSGLVTVSIGVASCLVHEGNDAAALIRAADLALYQAKNSGRNRVASGDVVFNGSNLEALRAAAEPSTAAL